MTQTLLTEQERRTLIYQTQLAESLTSTVQNNRIKWFIPNGKQEEFIDKIGKGDVFLGVFSAANGVGKTALLANILGAITLGDKVENIVFTDYEFFRNFPYPKRGRIASTKKNVEEVGALQTEIKQWFPKGSFVSKKMGKNYDSEYRMKESGWIFDIMTYEQDVQEYESATLGVMIFDEPPPLKILNACIARMRKGGIILIFMTPLDEGGEILEELSEKDQLMVDGKEIGKIEIVYADIEDNCKIHGKNGNLEHNDILQMLQFYDEEEKEARAKGKPTHLVGKIYPSFENCDPHVVEPFKIPEEWIRVNILDPHDAIPFALSWAAVDPTGQIWIYDEYPISDIEKIKSTSLTYPDYVRIVREREARDEIFRRIIDPFFGNKRFANDGKTPKEELADLGLDYDDGDTSGIDLGHKRVREFIKYDKLQAVSSLNHPKLHIFSSCRNHWRAMLYYKRKILKTGEVKDKIVVEETFKHFADNIRHFCMKYDDILNEYRNYGNDLDTDSMMAGGRGGW